jgi:hypothetical protein
MPNLFNNGLMTVEDQKDLVLFAGTRGSFCAPENYYFIKAGYRLRKVLTRLITRTNMPQSDLPFSFGYFAVCLQFS